MIAIEGKCNKKKEKEGKREKERDVVTEMSKH